MQGFFVAKLFIGMREVRSTATSHLSSDYFSGGTIENQRNQDRESQ
jgi:hypothetical protein